MNDIDFIFPEMSHSLHFIPELCQWNTLRISVFGYAWICLFYGIAWVKILQIRLHVINTMYRMLINFFLYIIYNMLIKTKNARDALNRINDRKKQEIKKIKRIK